MRKLFALLFVAAAFTFASCEKKGGETGTADSTTMVDTVAADPQPQMVDTAAATTDTTAATADTTAAQ